VRRERFRFVEDGVEAERDVIRHPGAVGVIAHDDEHVWLVRQPREAIGDPDVLEIPAGRLDKDGEEPLASAQRELAEEIGKAASSWEPLGSFFSSVGILDEEIHLFLATGLSDASADSGEQERIEVVRWPLDDLDGALAATKDSKTLIALTRLRDRLRAR
jgi:8-oxo-dGTP pyrophosphatase MutT (NUDIX family)